MTLTPYNHYTITVTTEDGTHTIERLAHTAREALTPLFPTLPDKPFGITVMRIDHGTHIPTSSTSNVSTAA